MSHVVEPIQGPGLDDAGDAVIAPRLARHQIALSDGHMAGISVAGRGIPLVVVHGFSAEGFLYAQTLSRLVSMGFKVIAVDTAGHGNTQGLPYDGQDLTAYSELLGRIVDELGLEQYILAGHSMGGRLVTQLAADRPEQVIAVLLIDAIVGDTWDKMVYLFRLAPPLLAAVGAALAVDTVSVLPLFRDPKQAAKLIRLITPTLAASGLITFARIPGSAAPGMDDHDPSAWIGQVRPKAFSSPAADTAYERLGAEVLDEGAGTLQQDCSPYVANSIGTINGGVLAVLVEVAAEAIAPAARRRTCRSTSCPS
jgi:pimeloyl-ACP methyl ester carboxylesterase